MPGATTCITDRRIRSGTAVRILAGRSNARQVSTTNPLYLALPVPATTNATPIDTYTSATVTFGKHAGRLG